MARPIPEVHAPPEPAPAKLVGRRNHASVMQSQAAQRIRARMATEESRAGQQQQFSEVGSMQQELQAALAKIRQDVESLSGVQEREGDEDREGPVEVVEEDVKRAESEKEKAVRQALVHRAEKEKEVKVIMSRPQKKVVADKPQDSSDDTDDEALDRPVSGSESDSSSGDVSDIDAEALLRRRRGRLSDAGVEDSEAQPWELNTSAVLQQLLQAINLEERTEMLEDLDCYYSRKQRQLEDEARKLDGLEEELTNENSRLEEDSADMRRTIDTREAGLYRVLRNYDLNLQKLAAMPEEDPKRMEDVKTELFKGQGRFMEESVAKSAEVLGVVAQIQESLRDVQARTEIEEKRLQAYQYTNTELLAAAKTASDAPSHDDVINEVLSEVCRNRMSRHGSGSSLDSDSPVDEDVFEHIARLSRECDDLRHRLEREQERDVALRRADGEEQHFMHRRLRKRMLTRKKANLNRKEAPAWESNRLFDLQAQQEYEDELMRIRSACDHTEHLIRSLQQIQVLAAGSVPSLEDGVRKLTEAGQHSKKNLSMGCLPEEEDPEEALIRDLKEANNEITMKHEAEHSSQMHKLEALEQRIFQDTRGVEDKVSMLRWALNREKEKRDLMDKEIRVRREQQTMAREKLESLPPLKIEEEQTEREMFLERVRFLEAEQEVTHKNLVGALRKAEAAMKTFKAARSVGADLASKMKWRQLEAGEDLKAHTEAISQWWQLVSDIQGEEPLQMDHVNTILNYLREEDNGGPANLMRNRVSILEVQRPKLAASSGTDQLAALISESSAANVRELIASNVRASVPAPTPADKDASLSRRKTRRKTKDISRQSIVAGGRARSRSRRLRSTVGSSQLPKILQARQKNRTDELLEEARNDWEQARCLHERTERICQAGAALEARAVQLLRLRGTSQLLPADLKVSFNLTEISDDQHDDPVVTALRREVRNRQQEFDLLSRNMRDIRTVARRGGRSILKSGIYSDDLRTKVLELCNGALDADPGPGRSSSVDSSTVAGAVGADDADRADSPALSEIYNGTGD